ncbi:hypothetical protein FKM82_026926 [Ascaphus truei]
MSREVIPVYIYMSREVIPEYTHMTRAVLPLIFYWTQCPNTGQSCSILDSWQPYADPKTSLQKSQPTVSPMIPCSSSASFPKGLDWKKHIGARTAVIVCTGGPRLSAGIRPANRQRISDRRIAGPC